MPIPRANTALLKLIRSFPSLAAKVEVFGSYYWRIIQGDYLMTNFGSNTQYNARLSTGIVLRF